MFNFKELKLNNEVNESDPFVGIRRSTSGNMEFRLPRGFADFPENDFDATKELFFRMYRTFKKFERDHPDKYLDTEKKRKDNIEKKNNGYTFSDSEGNSVVLYSKISVIENLLDAYDDLSLDVIERQIGINENIDYTQIDKYLDKAIYQEETDDEHVIYIDSMNLPRNVIQYKSATLIDMFCFILDELNNELKQGTESRVRELSSKFKEQYLSYDQSLFNEDTFEETIILLKDLLQSIDRATAYKDNDYWQLYEAIESFLYGELDMNTIHDDGSFWGISNFYQIWEDMCNTYSCMNFNLLYIDTRTNANPKGMTRSHFGNRSIFIDKDFTNHFFLSFRDIKEKWKWLRPDAIHCYRKEWILSNSVKINMENENNDIIDFKIPFPSKEGEKYYYVLCSEFKRWLGDPENCKTRQKAIEFKQYSKEKFYDCMSKIPIKKCVKWIYILDWKYKDISMFLRQNDSIDRDIIKQLCYEFCLQNSPAHYNLQSQFVIPFFYSDNTCYDDEEDKIGFKANEKELYQRLNESKIEVFKANFYTMQDAYLNND